MTNLKRRILITGAGSGVGRGLSLCLAQWGHSVVATDLNPEGARESAAQVEEMGGTAEAHSLDVTSEEDIGRLMRDIVKRPIDVGCDKK